MGQVDRSAPSPHRIVATGNPTRLATRMREATIVRRRGMGLRLGSYSSIVVEQRTFYISYANSRAASSASGRANSNR